MSYSAYLRVLNSEGTYVVAGGSMSQIAQATSSKKGNSNTGGQKTYIASLVQSHLTGFEVYGAIEANLARTAIFHFLYEAKPYDSGLCNSHVPQAFSLLVTPFS